MDQFPTGSNKADASDTAGEDFIPPPITGIPVGQPEENDQKTTTAETKSNQKKNISLPAWIQAVCGIAIVGITGFYTYYAKKQVEKTQDAIELSRTQFKIGQRPWIGFDATKGITIERDFALQDRGRMGTITLVYRLVNTGHSPAFVWIEGDWVKASERDRNEIAEGMCRAGKKNFTHHPMTVIPGGPSSYGIHYDGGGDTPAAPHRPAITIVPETQKYAHIGCIVYQSTVGGDALHQTPFVAYLNVGRLGKGDHRLTGPWIIGTAD